MIIMWQKAHPIWLRVGITKSWASERFAKTKSQSASFFVEDIHIRNYIESYYPRCGVSKIVIRKTSKEGEIIIFTAKVGLIMGKDWIKIKKFEDALEKKFGRIFKVIVKSIKIPELSAKIMAEHAASQIEGRMPYRRVAKALVQKTIEKWAMGIKVQMWWRLWWAEIARSEKFNEGRVPLQTLRTDIDYHYTQAITKYGVIGIKVWISKHPQKTASKTASKALLTKTPNI